MAQNTVQLTLLCPVGNNRTGAFIAFTVCSSKSSSSIVVTHLCHLKHLKNNCVCYGRATNIAEPFLCGNIFHRSYNTSQTKNGLRVFMLNAACSDRVQLILCLIKCQHIVGRNKKMCDIQVLCQIELFSCYSTANVPRPATSLQPSCSVYQENMQCPTLVLLEVI